MKPLNNRVYISQKLEKWPFKILLNKVFKSIIVII
jgi:hypothetical protein